MKCSRVFVVAVLTAGLSLQAGADEDSNEEMLRQIQAQLTELNTRIARIEALLPTFTTMMPEVAERFHVMHRAGEAGDWAVAGHELAEIKRIVGVSRYIDAATGDLMVGFLTGPLAELGEAIEHGDQSRFGKALRETVENCNACHKAAGSDFIQVTLDADRSLSMRHPHALTVSEQAMGHTHGGEAGHDEGEEGDEHREEAPHDEGMPKMKEDDHGGGEDRH